MELFPAGAGVILTGLTMTSWGLTVPRRGGGDPNRPAATHDPERLFPAGAGVILIL